MPSPQQTPWSTMMAQQAQGLGPRTTMNASTPEEQMMSQMPEEALAQTQQEVGAGIADGALDPEQLADVVKKGKEALARKRAIQSQGPMSQTAVPREQLNQDLVNQAQNQYADSFLEQKQGIRQLEENLNQMRQAPKGGLDYSPMVAFAKMHDPSLDTNSMIHAASSLKPETAEMQAERLFKLQNMLIGHKDDLTKRQLENLKERIAAAKVDKVDPLDREMKLSRIRANNAAAGMKAEGKILPETSIQKISDFDASLKELEDMSGNLDRYKSSMGPVTGRLNALNPFDTPAQSFQADIDRARQVIGKAVEGGVLRKEDEEKYQKMLPVLKDTPEVAKYKMQQFNNKMSVQRNSYVKNLKDGGYNTKGIGAVKQAPSANEPQEAPNSVDLNSMSDEELQKYIDGNGG